MECSPSGSSVQGILQARVVEWVAISFSREKEFPIQGLNLHLLHWQAGSLPTEPPWDLSSYSLFSMTNFWGAEENTVLDGLWNFPKPHGELGSLSGSLLPGPPCPAVIWLGSKDGRQAPSSPITSASLACGTHEETQVLSVSLSVE